MKKPNKRQTKIRKQEGAKTFGKTKISHLIILVRPEKKKNNTCK